MSAFVDEGEYTVDYIFFEVGKDIWVTCETACTEGAASLSLVLVSVYPSIFQEALAEDV